MPNLKNSQKTSTNTTTTTTTAAAVATRIPDPISKFSRAKFLMPSQNLLHTYIYKLLYSKKSNLHKCYNYYYKETYF